MISKNKARNMFYSYSILSLLLIYYSQGHDLLLYLFMISFGIMAYIAGVLDVIVEHKYSLIDETQKVKSKWE